MWENVSGALAEVPHMLAQNMGMGLGMGMGRGMGRAGATHASIRVQRIISLLMSSQSIQSSVTSL